mmetsp:Transcript_2082/g.6859  ORF Transcript_2082/g.6859 Transcript_2082/m.6859 type:complete len:248 (+) Transcript_2082:907-1650(+)
MVAPHLAAARARRAQPHAAGALLRQRARAAGTERLQAPSSQQAARGRHHRRREPIPAGQPCRLLPRRRRASPALPPREQVAARCGRRLPRRPLARPTVALLAPRAGAVGGRRAAAGNRAWRAAGRATPAATTKRAGRARVRREVSGPLYGAVRYHGGAVQRRLAAPSCGVLRPPPLLRRADLPRHCSGRAGRDRPSRPARPALLHGPARARLRAQRHRPPAAAARAPPPSPPGAAGVGGAKHRSGAG